MTIEEAIAHAKEQTEIFSGTHGKFLDVTIAALEKQTPKEVVVVDYALGETEYRCPSCSSLVSSTYCEECGQALDWSEVEEC